MQMWSDIGEFLKWTKDAVLGESPSVKCLGYSQDDTALAAVPAVRNEYSSRRNSWSGGDTSFYQKWDLLDSAESAALAEPTKPAAVFTDPTDTFGGRNGRRYGMRNGPRNDPHRTPGFEPAINDHDHDLLDRLLHGETPRSPETHPTGLPGKFPSPTKNIKQQDHTSTYLSLLDQLDANSKALEQLVLTAHTTRETQQTYKEQYLHTRTELIHELRQSKKIYDKYYNLFQKYQKLKTFTQEKLTTIDKDYSSTLRSKDAEIDLLQRRIQILETNAIDMKLDYETKIKELESHNRLANLNDNNW